MKKIVDEFEANGDDYDRQVSLALSAGDIPDIMKVTTLDELQELYENDLIADLTESYESHASDYLKGIYDSYGGRALEMTFDGKIMAIPGTNADSGPSIVWISSDWLILWASQLMRMETAALPQKSWEMVKGIRDR